jgi:UTP--glucose-1-phosphate uridylyltransferase
LADIHFIWQKELKGLGDAINCAKHHVNNEPFVVLLGDTVIDANVPATRQLLDVFERHEESVVLLEEVARNRISRYGVINGEQIDSTIYQINDFVEKPNPDEAPSNLAIAGRYIFIPQIFDYLSQIKPGKGDEIQVTDAMRLMVRKQAMYGLKLNGKRCDIGNKEGFIKTNIEFALKRDDMSEQMQAYIKQLAKEL